MCCSDPWGRSCSIILEGDPYGFNSHHGFQLIGLEGVWPTVFKKPILGVSGDPWNQLVFTFLSSYHMKIFFRLVSRLSHASTLSLRCTGIPARVFATFCNCLDREPGWWSALPSYHMRYIDSLCGGVIFSSDGLFPLTFQLEVYHPIPFRKPTNLGRGTLDIDEYCGSLFGYVRRTDGGQRAFVFGSGYRQEGSEGTGENWGPSVADYPVESLVSLEDDHFRDFSVREIDSHDLGMAVVTSS